MHGKETLLPVSYLKHQNVQNCLKMDADDWARLEVDGNVQDAINAQYTQRCIGINKNRKLNAELSCLMLSPKTYVVDKKKYGGSVEPHLGCCIEYFDQLKKVYDGGNCIKPR